MLLLDQSLIERIGTMQDCIDVIDVAMRDVARGQYALPSRQAIGPCQGTLFGLMYGMAETQSCFGAKLLTIAERPADRALASHQGVVTLFDAESGLLTAILDAGAVTAMRTAAASAVATRCLARRDSRVLGLIGSGHLAHKHLEAIRLVRPIERVVVWSRTAENAERFARSYRDADVRVTVAGSVQEAVSEADVICTLTSSTEPVLRGDWLAPGQHINAVGSGVATRRELDEEAVRRARFFADFCDFIREQGGEYLAALHSGRIDRQHLLGNIGAVLDGQLAGRMHATDITLYKSFGLIAQDMAYARHLVDKARSCGACPDIPFATRAR